MLSRRDRCATARGYGADPERWTPWTLQRIREHRAYVRWLAGGVDCTLKLSGDLTVLWQKPWVVLRPGTPYFCGAQDPRTLFTADLGAGWRTISSGGLEFQQAGLLYIVPVLPKALALRVSLQGDSAAHLGVVTATVHCRDTAP